MTGGEAAQPIVWQVGGKLFSEPQMCSEGINWGWGHSLDVQWGSSPKQRHCGLSTHVFGPLFSRTYSMFRFLCVLNSFGPLPTKLAKHTRKEWFHVSEYWVSVMKWKSCPDFFCNLICHNLFGSLPISFIRSLTQHVFLNASMPHMLASLTHRGATIPNEHRRLSLIFLHILGNTVSSRATTFSPVWHSTRYTFSKCEKIIFYFHKW